VLGEAVWVKRTACRHSSCCADDGTIALVFLYAFDLLELDGTDLRPLQFEGRRAALAKLVSQAQRLWRRRTSQ
jgi:ATP-dependent DNA ligase